MPKLPIRPRPKKPRLSTRNVLRWADAFFARHRRWPRRSDGAVEDAGDQTWAAADRALPEQNTPRKLARHSGRESTLSNRDRILEITAFAELIGG